jgi:hypothetical protein
MQEISQAMKWFEPAGVEQGDPRELLEDKSVEFRVANSSPDEKPAVPESDVGRDVVVVEGSVTARICM